MDCKCIIEDRESRPTYFSGSEYTRKIIKNPKSAMGHAVKGRESGRWLATVSAEEHCKLAWVRATDCDECKHRLACLIDPECNRRFESK